MNAATTNINRKYAAIAATCHMYIIAQSHCKVGAVQQHTTNNTAEGEGHKRGYNVSAHHSGLPAHRGYCHVSDFLKYVF